MKSRNPFRRFLRLFILAAVLVAPVVFIAPLRTSAQRQGRQPARQPRETIIFVISGTDEEGGRSRELSMDALAVIRGGKYFNPIDEYDQKAEKLFADKYYRNGQRYRVLYGGGHVGTASVKGWAEGCNAIHAKVGAELSIDFPGRASALATNSETLGRKLAARREVTSAERAAVLTLAKNIYRQHKTDARLLAKLQTNKLTAADLDGDGQFEIIGDFKIQTGDITGARRDLFLIATPAGKAYKAELAYFQSYRMDSGFGRGIGFADHLDMDGDGISEVVTVNEGFDAYSYSIYKKRRGRWRVVHTVTGDAC
jgi:hypothetical protein